MLFFVSVAILTTTETPHIKESSVFLNETKKIINTTVVCY